MSRFEAIDPTAAQGEAGQALQGVQKMLGAIPNMFRVAAQAPSVLQGMVALFGSTAHGSLRPSTREAIALAVAQSNACDYCLSAHSYLGARAGLSERQLQLARDASADDPKTSAILKFVRRLVSERGQVGEDAVATLRGAGVSEPETLEIVANVALNIFTNYLNNVAGTEIDFPVVRAAGRSGA
jgi:uncharacterized peroxidase-related enzyme